MGLESIHGRVWGTYLADQGISDLRERIRKEAKERREAILAWIVPLIGLIGALIGLIAIIFN